MRFPHMNQHVVDMLVVGGGINGAGIARDATGRGLSVVLCDKGDFGCATSSASSKLIHGGLRYLEHLAFNFVRSALQEREYLLKNAPHLVRPLRFIIPHNKQMRSYWLMRLGLFIYDHLGAGHMMPRSASYQFPSNNIENPICLSYKKGFSYYDGWTDDSRLVLANCIDAQRRGATLLPRYEMTHVQKQSDHWLVTLEHTISKHTRTVKTKAIINATGPWAQKVCEYHFGEISKYKLKLVQGSHIIVPKLTKKNVAYLLQNNDSRVIFVIPYYGKFSMIGTTDISYSDDPAHAKCAFKEIEYLCKITSQYFHHAIKPQNVVHSFSGVRALVDDGESSLSAISREHALEIPTDNIPLLLNVYGGKLTTFRQLSSDALDRLQPYFPHMKAQWTKDAPLPGGDIPNMDMSAFKSSLYEQYPHIPKKTLKRCAYQYGSECHTLFANIQHASDLGQEIGSGLFERELEYLIDHEWAQTTQDILWRRTKLGLVFNEEQEVLLADMMGQYVKTQTQLLVS